MSHHLKIKRYIFYFGFILLIYLLFSANDALANLGDGPGMGQAPVRFKGLLDLIKNNAAKWDQILRGYATSLFWLLASINFVWVFFPLVMKQADLSEILGELIKFILTIGFFFALLTYSSEWGFAIVDSFREAGSSASGLGKTFFPGDMFGVAVDLAWMVGNVPTVNPLTAMMVSLAAVVVLLCFAFIAAFMGLTIIESYIVINASVLFLGFGGSQWTREYAMAIIRYAVSVGAKLFILTLLVGLISQSVEDWQKLYNSDDEASMWTMVGLSLTCAYFAKTIPELVAGVISGTSSGNGNAIGSMASAAAAGAAAGAALAAGTAATVATGGLAAPVAAGGVAAAGGGAAAAGGGAAAAGGGAAASGGLAGSISSSLAGGSSAMTSGASAGMGSSGVGSSIANGTAKTGASAANMAKGTSGATTGGTGGSGSGSSMSKLDIAKQATKSDSNESNQSSERPPAAPQARSGSMDSNTSSSSNIGSNIYAAADLATKGVGILAAISVPGMESSAGLSLGNAPQPQASSSEGTTDNTAFRSEPLPSAEPSSNMTNTIRPANDEEVKE